MDNLKLLKIVLIKKDAGLLTLNLPSKREGRYYLGDSESNDSKAIFKIDGVDNKWIATSSENICFQTETGKTTKVEITENTSIRVVSNETEYILFVDPVDKESVFLPYYLTPNQPIIIGRSDDACDIVYKEGRVSSRHTKIWWENRRWYISDLNSTNGVFVNEKRVRNTQELQPGDIIYILGLYLIIGVDFIAINNAGGKATIKTSHLRRITDASWECYANKRDSIENIPFDRVIRLCEDMSTEAIEIEMPPMKSMGDKVPLALRLSNQLVMSGQAIMSGNILSIASSLVMPTIMQGFNEKDKKDYSKARTEFYTEYIALKKQEIENEIIREKNLLERVYPSLNKVMEDFGISKKRLWERRKYDTDFLKVRIGNGNVPLMAKIKYRPRSLQMEKDELLDMMYELAEKNHRITDGAVIVDLKENFIIGATGNHDARLQLISHLVLQLAFTHSYDEVKIVFLVDNKDKDKFDYVRYLPHCWDNEKNSRFYCENASDTQLVSKHINKQLEEIQEAKKGYSNAIKRFPSYVIISTSKELYDSMECLKVIQESDAYEKFSIIAAFDGMPKECTQIVECFNERNYKLVNLFETKDQTLEFKLDLCNPSLIKRGLLEIMKTKLNMEGAKYALPTMLTFLELFEAGRVEHLNPLLRWRENNPVKSLAAPLGYGTDGKRFMLDLHEKYHGPHGLIAGGTGSGKSEFIITYILSMAVNYSPDEVAFVLIDYKGGGLADAFVSPKKGIHLPHVVGTITNLDGAAISRSILSIHSELKRRQEVFKKAKGESDEGTMDIYDYQKMYRNGQVKEPLPHLFIISDEFAELKQQQPEFMEELISIARIGRSLGVHLILATQRPTGVVNDQIWSNSKFRICLRVATKSDSIEMLKRPEAAEIRNTGRFYLQVGFNELFALGQSAWCGADYIPQDEIAIESDQSVTIIDNVGMAIAESKPKKDDRPSEGKQIVAIVKYLSDLSKEEGINPKQLWCNPLPYVLDYDELANKVSYDGFSDMTAIIGMIDDPAHQKQFPFMLDVLSFRSMLITGNGGSGKSNLVRTMLYSLTDAHSPEEFNYYILDLSGGILRPFSSMPHCGAYLTEENANDFDRLLVMIKEIIAKRRELFAQADVTTYEAYIKINKLPLIFVVLDGYSNINMLKNGPDIYSSLYEYIREAGPYGIRFIVVINHLNEIHSKSKQEIEYKICLQGKDKYEYTDVLDKRVNFVVAATAGRGVCVYNDEPLEYHVAMPDANCDEQVRAKLLKERLEKIASRYKGVGRAQALPMVDGNEEYADFSNGFDSGRIPLGYNLQDMKRIAMPLQQLDTMSLYFGNPAGTRPVFENIIYASKINDMETIILKKNSDSVFASYGNKKGIETNGATLYDTTAQSIIELFNRLISEIKERNIYRDEFCENNGIPTTDKFRVQKAFKYIKDRTKSLLVIFESLADVCRIEKTEELEGVLPSYEQVFFRRLKGYNIYFVAGFYPEDYEFRSNSFVESFCSSKFAALYGGRLDKQIIIDSRSEFYNRTKINQQYDKFVMSYRDQLYSLRMPCGELILESENPDEDPII